MHTPITPLAQVRALYRLLDERAQLAIMCDLIQGGDCNLDRSDGFVDALQPVDAAFDDAWADLENAADDSAFDVPLTSERRAVLLNSTYMVQA